MIITLIANRLTNSSSVLNLLYELANDYHRELLQSNPLLKEIVVELITPLVSDKINLSGFAFSEDETVLKLYIQFLPEVQDEISTVFLMREMESIQQNIMA